MPAPTNRMLIGTKVDEVTVFAVYDPFYDNIDIEVDGRMWQSLPPSITRKYATLAETFAIDLHFLLLDRYNYGADAAFKLLQDCQVRITNACR